MSVKSFKWPEGFQPHTLLIDENEGRWSFAICDATAHIHIAPGHEPQYNILNGEKVIKDVLHFLP